MKLAGMVVLYNPTDDVAENIKSYINSVDVLYAVDNSTSDNSGLFSNKKIVYMPNNKNLGIAKALNIGAKTAISNGYDWLLTMDQDSSFSDKSSLENMKMFISYINSDKCLPYLFGIDTQKIGIVSPFHVLPTQKGELPKGYAFSDVVMTSGNLVNLSAYKQVGGYNEDYFIDAVDFDFCFKLRKNLYDVICLNYVRMEHCLGDPVFKTVLSKHMYSYNHNYIRQYYIVRNRKYFCETYKNIFPAFCKAEKKRTFREAAKILLIEKDKFRKLLYMYRGYKDYKRGIKGEIPEEYKQ